MCGKDAILKIFQLARVAFKLFCAGYNACHVGERNLHLATPVRKNLAADKNSPVFEHQLTPERFMFEQL